MTLTETEEKPIGPDTPLRLDAAARQFFPDGGMTASGLRREAARGNLVIERVAGKDYTTLREIEKMRKLCRVERKAPGYGSSRHAGTSRASSSSKRFGSPATGLSNAAQELAMNKLATLRKQLSTPSQNISTRGNRRASLTVIHPKS